MSYKKALTDEQEKALVVDYEDGFRVVELVTRYSVSESTVYRILADYGAKKTQGRGKRKPLRKMSTKQLKPCGTDAAYRRHKRNGEYPCPPCLEARARTQKEWSDARRAQAASADGG